MSKLLPFDPDAKCPKCGNTEEARMNSFLHEVGQVLGLGGHTPAPAEASRRDIMSEVNKVRAISSFLGGIMRLWRGVNPGNILVPG